MRNLWAAHHQSKPWTSQGLLAYTSVGDVLLALWVVFGQVLEDEGEVCAGPAPSLAPLTQILIQFGFL